MKTKMEAARAFGKERCFEDLAASIASGEGDLQAAEKLREQEAKVFGKAEQGLVSTVDALDRALAMIGHEERGSPERSRC